MSYARTLTGATNLCRCRRSAARPVGTSLPPRGGANRPRAALAALVFAAALVLPLGVAAAQTPTETTLVSNTGQSAGNTGSDTYDHAQMFTTGSNADGYTLTEAQIEFRISGTSVPSLAVEIWTATAPTELGTRIATLTAPASLQDGVNSFTSSTGVSLAASSKYMVLVNVHSGGVSWNIQNTGSSAEDAGAAPGWSIADGSGYRIRSETRSTLTYFNAARKIAIRGYADTASGTDTPSTTTPTTNTGSGASVVTVGAAAWPGVPSVDAGGSVEETAKAAAAAVLGVEEDDLDHQSTKKVVWNNSSLGCMRPGYAYTPVMTPGREVDFGHGEEGEETASVRVPDHGSHVVVCRP